MEIEHLLEQILKEVTKRKSSDHPFVLGVCGIERSGKTEFAKKLSSFLESKKYKTQLLHLDDFLNPKKTRYAGKDLAKTYFQKGYDLDKLIDKVLNPVHQKKSFNVELRLLNYDTDKLEEKKKYTFDENTIVIIEGVFLYRKELSPYIDYKIFLDISFEESKKRAEERDVPIYGKEILETSNVRYWPAQKEYLDKYPPSEIADLVIDYNDWENPSKKF